MVSRYFATLSQVFLLFSVSFSTFAFIPQAPNVEAEAYILIDYNSNAVLASKNENERMDPASLTKMMTMYVIDSELKANNIKPSDMVTISENAWRTQGSRMFIEVNKQISIENLIKGIIIQSGNDASIAMAEHIGGSESTFASLMNEHAKRLGMNNSHFMNATGLPDPEHYTTAKDLSILSAALIRDFPKSYSIYSQKEFVYQNIKQPNRNRLLWSDNYVDGIKTGHSSTAGYCLAASGQQNGMRLISIVLGSKTEGIRTESSQKLLRYGFRFYETYHVFKAFEPLKEPRVWMGMTQTLNLGINKDLYVTVPRGQYDKLGATMTLVKRIEAPITKGNPYGQLSIKLKDELLINEPLIALENIEQGSLWNRFSDYVSLGFHKLFNSEV